MKYLLALSLLVSHETFAQDKPPMDEAVRFLEEVSVMAKGAGMCGTIGQISRFQDSTKMPGGHEFVIRFFNTEAARLGISFKQFLVNCVDYEKKYAQFVEDYGLFADKGTEKAPG